MRRYLTAAFLILLLAVPGLGGVKKFVTPIAPSGTALAGTSTYQSTYVCDALSDLTAITGQGGDVGIVTGYGTSQVFLWNGILWLPAAYQASSTAIAVQAEYFSGTTVGGTEWTTASATGAISAGTATASHPGVVNVPTGASSTGRFAIITQETAIALGYGTVFHEAVIQTPAALSTGSQRYQITSGIRDTWSSIDAVDGCYFRYKDDVNSGKWECVCRSNSVETASTMDSGTTVQAATWYRLGVWVNAAATEAKFYINGTLVGTHITANIPTGAGRETGVGVGINKTVGATTEVMVLDTQRFSIGLTTAR